MAIAASPAARPPTWRAKSPTTTTVASPASRETSAQRGHRLEPHLREQGGDPDDQRLLGDGQGDPEVAQAVGDLDDEGAVPALVPDVGHASHHRSPRGHVEPEDPRHGDVRGPRAGERRAQASQRPVRGTELSACNRHLLHHPAPHADRLPQSVRGRRGRWRPLPVHDARRGGAPGRRRARRPLAATARPGGLGAGGRVGGPGRLRVGGDPPARADRALARARPAGHPRRRRADRERRPPLGLRDPVSLSRPRSGG